MQDDLNVPRAPASADASEDASAWMAPIPWRWLGERGLRVETGAATLACYAALRRRRLPEVEDIIPASDSLLLVLRPGAPVPRELWAELVGPWAPVRAGEGRLHEIAVAYGGDAGPDLGELAAAAGLDEAGFIALHAGTEYTVAFLGFQPGFPYLRGLPGALHAPRRGTPRMRVAAGSVAIGGGYTGIYPTSGPGGWQIVGRTRARLFDPQRNPPALLAPGDRVRFVPA